MKTKLLGCGHPDSWAGSMVSCTDREGFSLCRECAHDASRKDLREHKNVFAYLHADQRIIQDFDGNTLATVQGRNGFKHSRTFGARLWTFRAVDVYGQMWACRHWPDSGTYVRMRKVGK